MTWQLFLIQVLDRIPQVLAGVTAILGLCIAYQARKKHYRELVYQKQCESCLEMLRALNELHARAWKFVVVNKDSLDDERRASLANECQESYFVSAKAFDLWAAFLPEKVIKSVADYIRTYKAIITSRTSGDEAGQLRIAMTEVIKAVNLGLHLGKISRENECLLGKVPQ